MILIALAVAGLGVALVCAILALRQWRLNKYKDFQPHGRTKTKLSGAHRVGTVAFGLWVLWVGGFLIFVVLEDGIDEVWREWKIVLAVLAAPPILISHMDRDLSYSEDVNVACTPRRQQKCENVVSPALMASPSS
jgi:hypothetical protein